MSTRGRWVRPYSKVKEWRKAHPEELRAQKIRQKAREHLTSSIGIASGGTYHSHYWSEQDKVYLEDSSKVKTALDIALHLGRTYHAILNKASKLGISLFTEDKKRGRLVSVGKE